MSSLSRITYRSSGRAVVALALASSLVFGAVVTLSGASAAAKTPPSTPTDAAPHCLTRVTGKSASGELRLSTPACYASFADVLRQAGATVADDSAGPSEGALGGGGAAALSGIIGTHFDGLNFTGASITVGGSDCSGGYINLTGWWANRVSSTINGCPAVIHYYWPDLQGSSEALYGGGGNLSWLDNLSESISYNS